MIERLISFSLRNRFLVLLIASGIFVWGIYAVKTSKIDAIPDLSENQVIVFTEWRHRLQHGDKLPDTELDQGDLS